MKSRSRIPAFPYPPIPDPCLPLSSYFTLPVYPRIYLFYYFVSTRIWSLLDIFCSRVGSAVNKFITSFLAKVKTALNSGFLFYRSGRKYPSLSGIVRYSCILSYNIFLY